MFIFITLCIALREIYSPSQLARRRSRDEDAFPLGAIHLWCCSFQYDHASLASCTSTVLVSSALRVTLPKPLSSLTRRRDPASVRRRGDIHPGRPRRRTSILPVLQMLNETLQSPVFRDGRDLQLGQLERGVRQPETEGECR